MIGPSIPPLGQENTRTCPNVPFVFLEDDSFGNT